VGNAGLLVHNACVKPDWVKDENTFVSWMKNIEKAAKAGIRLAANEIDDLVRLARGYKVDVRLDPPHPNTPWDMPHINIGRKGYHIPVPDGYQLPTQ